MCGSERQRNLWEDCDDLSDLNKTYITRITCTLHFDDCEWELKVEYLSTGCETAMIPREPGSRILADQVLRDWAKEELMVDIPLHEIGRANNVAAWINPDPVEDDQ